VLSSGSLHSNVTDDICCVEKELKRFEECLQKEDFRKLLDEYAREISDPKVKEVK